MIYLYIYIIGIVLSILLCRIPRANDVIHNTINSNNPSVTFIILWPITWLVFSIMYGYKFIMSFFNWMAGNGFVPKTMEVTGSTMGCNHKAVDIRFKGTK